MNKSDGSIDRHVRQLRRDAIRVTNNPQRSTSINYIGNFFES